MQTLAGMLTEINNIQIYSSELKLAFTSYSNKQTNKHMTVIQAWQFSS